jgi:hypothetical protein
MENPVLLITETKDQDIDRQLAKSIGAGDVMQQSRGTPIIEELWHGTITPSERLAKSEKKAEVVVHEELGNSPVSDAIMALISKGEEAEDDELPEEKFKAKDDDEDEDEKKSEVEFFIDLVKADEEDDSTMTDAEAEGAADREANKDDSEDEGEEKSLSDVLNDLIKAAGKQGEGSRGGKIIGHTRSGKPIYQGQKASSEGLTKEDHHDAAAIHAHNSLRGGGGAEARGLADEHASSAGISRNETTGSFNRGELKDHAEKHGLMSKDAGEKKGPSKASQNRAARAQMHQMGGSHFQPIGNEVFRDAKPADAESQAMGKEIDKELNASGHHGDKEKSLPEGDLSKGTAMGVPEIKVDQYGIPLYEGVAFEVHDDADKNTVRELINAGLVGDPEHDMDKRVPQVINRVLGGVY